MRSGRPARSSWRAARFLFRAANCVGSIPFPSTRIRLIAASLTVLALAAFCRPAQGETIVRTDGRKIEGQIVEEGKDYVKVQTTYGVFRIGKDQIASISGRRAVSQNEREGNDALAAGDLDLALSKYQAALKEVVKTEDRKPIEERIAEINRRMQEREEKRFAAQLATADRLVQEKKFADAMVELNALLKRNPPDSPAAKMIQQRKGQLRMAEAAYYIDQINYTEAADAYLKAIDLMPENADPHLRMARLIQKRGGKDTDAIDYYLKGLELALRSRSESSLLDDYYELGKTYLRAANSAKDPRNYLMEGIKCLLVVSRDGATSYPFVADKLEGGFVQLSKTKYDHDAMIKMLQSTLEFNPGAQKARWILAEVSSLKGQYDKTIECLRKIEADAKAAGQALPEELYYRLGLAYLALPTPDRAKALEAFENEIRQNKLNYMALIRAAQLHTMNGLYDDALEYCNRALILRKERPEAYLVAGDAHLRRNLPQDLEEARGYLKKALEVKSDFQPARIRLAEIEIMQQRKAELPNYQPAIELLLLALQGLSKIDQPTDEDQKARAEATLLFAEIENDKNNPREAAAKVKEALAIYARFPRAYRVQGQIQVALETYDEAKESYKKAIELDPEEPETYMLMGMLCHNYIKDYKEAIRYYDDYLRLQGPDIERVGRWKAECERVLSVGTGQTTETLTTTGPTTETKTTETPTTGTKAPEGPTTGTAVSDKVTTETKTADKPSTGTAK